MNGLYFIELTMRGEGDHKIDVNAATVSTMHTIDSGETCLRLTCGASEVVKESKREIYSKIVRCFEGAQQLAALVYGR